jgi:hypothetical protein
VGRKAAGLGDDKTAELPKERAFGMLGLFVLREAAGILQLAYLSAERLAAKILKVDAFLIRGSGRSDHITLSTGG